MKDFETMRVEYNKKLEQLAGMEVDQKTYGKGIIVSATLGTTEYVGIVGVDVGLSILGIIEFADCKKQFDLSIALSKSMTISNPDLFASLQAELDGLKEVRVAELKVKQEALIKEQEEKLAEEKRLKEQIKFEKHKRDTLQKFKALRPEKTSFIPTTYYETLGWIAKHLNSIKPAMPDWMESAFVATFGDVNRTVVDSKKRTTGGFPMQWGLSCKMSFNTEVVGPLELKATSQNKKVIDNVALVYDLVDNCGFQFGSTQDLDKILETVPAQYLEDFRRGYAM